MMYKIMLILAISSKLSANKVAPDVVVCYSSTGQITKPIDKEKRLEVGKTELDELTSTAHQRSFFGTPTCIYVFGITVSNEILYQQEIVSTFRLPFACSEQYENTNCFNIDGSLFPDPVTNERSKLASGFMCCCSNHECNSINNPIILMQFENYWKPSRTFYYSIAPIFRYFACLLVFLIITGVLSSCDAVTCMIVSASWKALKKHVFNFDLPPAINEVDMGEQMSVVEKNSNLKLNDTQKSDVVENQTQCSAPSDPANKGSAPRQKQPGTNPRSEGPHHKRDEESTQYEELVPVPQTPGQRVLPTGRLQKVSMNYEESTFSDLENP